MLLSSSDIDKCNISLCTDDIILKPEPRLLGVFLDDQLSFNQHVSISCTKAARQPNALVRISRYLNISPRSLRYNSFVEKQTITKLKKKMKERALRMTSRAYESSHEVLLSAAEAPTMLSRRLRVILLEVFK